MLSDLLMELKNAKTQEEKETAYRKLAYVGMDRMTADAVIEEL